MATPVLVLVGAGMGCSSDNVRSNLYVTEINNGEALTSDVINRGADQVASGDDFVFEDEVQVTIWNTKRDDLVDTGSAYRSVTVDRYEVSFESEEEIEGFSQGLGWLVQTGSTYEGTLTVVPASAKARTPLVALQSGGEILATAHITFYGHEADSDNELTFTTSVPVHFANWNDNR